MKTITFVTALAAAISAVYGLTVNSPSSVVECEPTQFSWSGGQAPYYLTLVPAGQSAAPAIKQFPTQQGTSYTWDVDLQSGTSFTIALKDSTGATAYSSIITIQSGTSTSCVNTSVQEGGGSSASSSGTGSAASPSSTGGSATSAASTVGTSATGTSASPSTPTTTASGSTTTQSSAAGRLSASSTFGVAGIMGLVGVMLF